MASMFLACPTYDFNPFTFPALMATFGVIGVFVIALVYLLPFIFRRRLMGFAKDEIGRQAILRRARLARVFARGVAVVGRHCFLRPAGSGSRHARLSPVVA